MTCWRSYSSGCLFRTFCIFGLGLFLVCVAALSSGTSQLEESLGLGCCGVLMTSGITALSSRITEYPVWLLELKGFLTGLKDFL